MRHLTYAEYIMAKKMVNTLCENTNILSFFHQEVSLYDLEDVFYDMGYEFSCGMTKGVLYNNDLLPNWVIKFDLDNHPFVFRDNKIYSHCELEHHIYRQAVCEGFNKYFATCKYLCSIDNIKFYLMEYVDCDKDKVESQFVKSIKASSKTDSKDDDEIYDIMYEQDTFDTIMVAYDDLTFACWASSHYLTDLHSGNFGYTFNNELVIIDYSGYGYKRI